MPTDLSMWDMNPKSGLMPLSCIWTGYLSVPGYAPIYDVMNGETVTLQMLAQDGSWIETGQSTITGTDPSNSSYFGYFSGSVTLPSNMLSAGTYKFRVNYAGNSAKGLAASTSPPIGITLMSTTIAPIPLKTIAIVAGVGGAAVAIGVGAYYASKKK